MPIQTRTIATAVAAVSLTIGCSQPQPESKAAAETPTPRPPAAITAARGGFIPEGVEFDTTTRRFLTGSIAEGSVMAIGNDGSVTPVVKDPDLVASVGIEVDEERDRLLVANSNNPFAKGGTGQAKLGVYRLSTGERLAMVDLAATVATPPAGTTFFANDVAVGSDGTAYVTDTRANLVYQVTPGYQASVLHKFDGFGPNGIVFHPSGYLLVVGGARMFKVPVANPDASTEVKLPEEVPGQDGAVWTADGRLAVVSNSSNRVVAFTSADDWATARIAAQAPLGVQATTAAVAGDDVYVVQPHFNDANPPVIERVTFK
jgi:sugar lactone lactonase YvrE